MSTKTQFGSKIGLVAATVGSAVGLGNVWRFPAEAQANGGAAFLLLYLGCVLILGVPVMVAEFALGRGGGSDAVGSFKNLGAGKHWWLVGGLAVIASYLIMSFYMVVAGWTLEYMWQSVTGALYAPIEGIDSLRGLFQTKMDSYVVDDLNPLIATWIVIAINIGVLMAGVQKGIERLSNWMMPLLFVLLLVFMCYAMTLPGAGDGLKFFFNPDFSKITTETVLKALGQTFFSLSLGMGILVTYASYYPADTKLTRTALTVSLMATLVAVMVGMIIFPGVMSFHLEGEEMQGSTLVFVTLPEMFAQMPLSAMWSVMFFLLLFVAALTSTISIAEVSVAFLQERFGMRRLPAVLTSLLPLLAVSSVCSLSQGSLSGFTVFGMTVFELFDYVATNILLPIGSIFLCIYVGWFAPKGMFRNQITNNGTIRSRMAPVILSLVRYVAPLLIAIVLISTFL